MRAFTFRRGEFVAELDAGERAIIARVIADTALLLGEDLRRGERPEPGSAVGHELSWSTEGLEAPTDPALARLVPTASKDDDGVAAEFRRLTEADLKSGKAARLRLVWESLTGPGEKVRVAPERAMDWAAALTDVRLVLSERLEIRTDADAEAVYERAEAGAATGERSEEDEVRAALGSLYAALTWLQESLLQVMLPTLDVP